MENIEEVKEFEFDLKNYVILSPLTFSCFGMVGISKPECEKMYEYLGYLKSILPEDIKTPAEEELESIVKEYQKFVNSLEYNFYDLLRKVFVKNKVVIDGKEKLLPDLEDGEIDDNLDQIFRKDDLDTIEEAKGFLFNDWIDELGYCQSFYPMYSKLDTIFIDDIEK